MDYTPVKYVKKPAGARPGMVVYTTYQTAYVDPDPRLGGHAACMRGGKSDGVFLSVTGSSVPGILIAPWPRERAAASSGTRTSRRSRGVHQGEGVSLFPPCSAESCPCLAAPSEKSVCISRADLPHTEEKRAAPRRGRDQGT